MEKRISEREREYVQEEVSAAGLGVIKSTGEVNFRIRKQIPLVPLERPIFLPTGTRGFLFRRFEFWFSVLIKLIFSLIANEIYIVPNK